MIIITKRHIHIGQQYCSADEVEGVQGSSGVSQQTTTTLGFEEPLWRLAVWVLYVHFNITMYMHLHVQSRRSKVNNDIKIHTLIQSCRQPALLSVNHSKPFINYTFLSSNYYIACSTLS